MIIIKEANLMDAPETVIVNPVNCVGIMGAGVAHELKYRYPHNFKVYKEYCDDNSLYPGSILPVHDSGKIILNLATKAHWKNPSKLEWIVTGLHNLREYIVTKKCAAIAMPAIGCGNGKLDWEDVRALITGELGIVDCDVTIYVLGAIANFEKLQP